MYRCRAFAPIDTFLGELPDQYKNTFLFIKRISSHALHSLRPKKDIACSKIRRQAFRHYFPAALVSRTHGQLYPNEAHYIESPL